MIGLKGMGDLSVPRYTIVISPRRYHPHSFLSFLKSEQYLRMLKKQSCIKNTSQDCKEALLSHIFSSYLKI